MGKVNDRRPHLRKIAIKRKIIRKNCALAGETANCAIGKSQPRELLMHGGIFTRHLDLIDNLNDFKKTAGETCVSNSLGQLPQEAVHLREDVRRVSLRSLEAGDQRLIVRADHIKKHHMAVNKQPLGGICGYHIFSSWAHTVRIRIDRTWPSAI